MGTLDGGKTRTKVGVVSGDMLVCAGGTELDMLERGGGESEVEVNLRCGRRLSLIRAVVFARHVE